jgi:hypothetical protein
LRWDSASTRKLISSNKTTHPIERRLAPYSGLRPDEMVLLPKGSIPKTTSGKLQRARVRARHQQGTLSESAG